MTNQPLVAVVMGSQSDYDTMQHAIMVLKKMNIPYHAQVVSAHRTPDLLFSFASTAKEQGYEVIIAGAGGAAHLPGMIAAKCSLPVLGVPIKTDALNGMDSLLSMVQMPGGIPVGTLAIGKPGAVNAGLLAAAILANKYPEIQKQVEAFRQVQTSQVIDNLQVEKPS
jgi:5-(carboxyamino)imidazole ribonucleotide mutase